MVTTLTVADVCSHFPASDDEAHPAYRPMNDTTSEQEQVAMIAHLNGKTGRAAEVYFSVEDRILQRPLGHLLTLDEDESGMVQLSVYARLADHSWALIDDMAASKEEPSTRLAEWLLGYLSGTADD